ncbi:Cyanovirin-N [Westerdykella ornata]|uniref:Cyanovirin-N n=1 Tax=Westerdykella ornata TaxID=318751 RepID=A0A6A6J4Z6_WESOR|nr:Cyanovirin-N [Westerdykella ornata]KAF2271515.1 Cyanovirin-N [Westerdykella ornata]
MYLWLTLLHAFGIIATQAAPTATGFSKLCKDITLTGSWLVANCPDNNGASIQSSVYLPSKISNSDGNLVWSVDGQYQGTCITCSITSDGILHCTCWKAQGHTRDATINLEEHIAVYNGHLLSDLKGTPQPPSSSSPISMPSDLSWTFNYGDTSTYTPGSSLSALGATEAPGCTDYTVVEHGNPQPCLTERVPFSSTVDYIAFGGGKMTAAGGAWDVKVYDNLDCTGTPLGTITEFGTCKVFEKTALALQVLPKWNADV